ncbi:exodeoxyribonuclease V subunit gamma [Gracilimonas sp. Q87]|uniref:exodeoxyribonuclease V subunit gamma n=1 Tax=Gracilimonas sp. Q87 TaxID=3384766 RepID=UPI0039841CF2
MFYKYHSPSLTDLAKMMSEVDQSDSSNPLQPLWVVVQNNEIREWLSLQLSKESGIAGNFHFIFPSEFIWALYRLKNDDIPKSLPSDLNAMQWALFELFGAESSLISSIPSVNESDFTISKRFQLAGQIADIFDQYQVYRPDMLESWIQGKPITNHADEIWQLKLWKLLNKHWKRNDVNNLIPSRADAYNNIKSWLNEGDQNLIESLPEQIFIFGLSHLNRPFIEVSTGLSRHRDVHFFNREIKLKNAGFNDTELIGSWLTPNKKQRDYLNGILGDQEIQYRSFYADQDDSELPNIDLHSCHNTRREVEVLKDQILRFLDKHTDVQPADMLIMVPDPAQYASLIETIFNDSVSGNETSLPVTKLSRLQTQIYEHALVKILNVLNSSFKPSSVVDVLVLNPVKERFDFSDDDVDLLEEWINANSIYRGVGDSFNSPFSWQKGLNQLFAGFTMAPDFLEVYRGLVPTVGSTSSDELKLAAKFSKFIHLLLDCVFEVEKNKTPLEWLNLAQFLVEALLVVPDSTDKGMGLLRTIKKLNDQLAYTTSDEEVPYNLIKNWLKNQLNTTRSASGRFGQGVTVSTYVPYRSVPFKFIAVLGLNEDLFPRRSIRPEFDLIYKEPRTGDRIQSDDDTYLFLETLAAAEQHLHLSYIGQDQRTESDRLPSMLVQQLKEALPEESLNTIKHKLQAFSMKYFTDQKEPNGVHRSYSKKHRRLVENLIAGKNLIPEFLDDYSPPNLVKSVNLISVNDMISFYTDPSKHLLANYIGISERLFQNEVQDRELFKLGGLNRYRVDALLYDSLQIHSNVGPVKMLNYLQASGMIPDKLQGEKNFEQEYSNTKNLIKEIRKLTSGFDKEVEVSIESGGVEIHGNINGIYENSLVVHRIGKRRAVHEVKLWIIHNILLASDYPIVNSYYISVDNKENKVETLMLDSESIDKSIFSDLLKWYTSGKKTTDKLNFFPESSKEFVTQLMKGNSEEYALGKSHKKYLGGYNSSYAEGRQYYNKLIWKGKNPTENQAFKVNAKRFWEPFFKAVEASK